MKDHISAKERLYNPLKRWIGESLKELIILTVFFTSVLIFITQPGVIL